mgnify:CR=1 FL=1
MRPHRASRRPLAFPWRAVPFIAAFTAALGVSFLLAACSGAERGTVAPLSAPTVTANLGTEVTLAPGESVLISSSGLQLTFNGVTTDSRCPTNALIQCIWAGSAQIALRVASSSGQRDLHIETAVPRDTVTVDRYLVRLVRVAPAPVTTERIPAASYRATLRIDRK